MANALVDKVESEMTAEAAPSEECTGPECCASSTCVDDVPGMSCASYRGATRCVGAKPLSLHKGLCACLKGACNPNGNCPEIPTAEEMVQIQAQLQQQQQQQQSQPQQQ